MEYKYKYTTNEEREIILNDHIDLVLREEQNIKEGNFLIFIDTDTAKQLASEYIARVEQYYITERINTISEYVNLNNNSIDTLESAILEYETNLIIGGV
jgi:DNA-binding sugar fermentation-stimulating protein